MSHVEDENFGLDAVPARAYTAIGSGASSATVGSYEREYDD